MGCGREIFTQAEFALGDAVPPRQHLAAYRDRGFAGYPRRVAKPERATALCKFRDDSRHIESDFAEYCQSKTQIGGERMIDLKQFCGKNGIRYHLNEPFSEGEFSYATNGHILVRVARRTDVPEVSADGMKNKIPRIFADNPFVKHVAIPEIPAQIEVECDYCDGEGKHDRECGAGNYECAECNGTGRVMGEAGELGNTRYPQIEVGGVWFAPRYLRLIKALPNYSFSPRNAKASLFTFDGGDGLLMPMRKV